MKKYMALALVICMMLSLCACGDHTEPTTVPTTAAPTTIPATAPITQPTTQPTVPETTVDVSALPTLSVAAITMITETERSEGDILFEYNYPDVMLTLPNEAITNTVMLELLNRIDSTRTAAEDILGTAGSDYLSFYDVGYDPMRIDPNVLSLYGSQTSYAGGPHPTSECISVTYDLTNGNVLTLGDVLSPNCTAADLTPLVNDVLAKLSEETYLYSDYTATVEERFGQGFGTDQGWYLSNEGLCIYFSPYEIAPYSSGEIVATIPYEDLGGLMRDQFFPVEKSGGAGVVDAIEYNECSLVLYEQFYEVVIDEEGVAVLLTTDGLVYDFTLEYGSWDSDGIVFTPTSTVFAASSLSYCDGVVVRLYIPDVMPNLRLTYTTEEGTFQKYIFQSGKDGSILLLDN